MLRQAVAMGLAASVLICTGGAQTQIDIRTQTRNVDFSKAISTMPFAVVDNLPAICSTGQAAFRRDTPSGQNLYLCTATNTWVPTVAAASEGGGVSGTAPIPGSVGGIVITSTLDGAAIDVDTAFVATQAGDNQYTGHNDFTDAASLRLSRATGAPDPASCDATDETGRVLLSSDRGSGLALSICQQTGADTYAWQAAHHMIAASAPAQCTPGEVYFNTAATPGENWFGCTSSNVWTKLGGGGAASPAMPGGADGDIQCNAAGEFGPCAATGTGPAVRKGNAVLSSARFENASLGSGYLSITRTAGTGGVIAFTTVTLNDSATVVNAATASADVIGIATQTTAAGAAVEIATSGIVNCVTENATTTGRLAVPGITVGGRCRDSGASTSTAIPATTQILGRWLSNVAAGQTGQLQLFGAGLHGAHATTEIVKCQTGGSTSGATQTELGNAILPPLDPGAEVRLSMSWSHDGGTTIAPRLRIAVGGTDILPIHNWTATDTARETQARIAVTGAANQYNTFLTSRYPSNSQVLNSPSSTTVDTRVPTTVQIFGALLSDGTAAGESVTLRQYCVSVLPAKP